VADLNITSAKITNDAVDKTKLAADVAGSGLGQNADGSLETIVDGSTMEVSADALQVKDAGIVAAKLATNSVTTAKLASNAVTTAKITDANVTEAKLDIATASGAGVDGYILKWDNTAGKMDWSALAIDQDEKVKTQSGSAGILSDTYFLESAGVIDLKDASVSNAKLATDAVETANIKDGEVKTADVADLNITNAKITDDAVDKDKIAADVAGSGLSQNADGSLETNVDGSSIEINADVLQVKDAGIVTAKLASNAVTTAKLATNAVTTAKITDGNVTEAKLDIATASGAGVDGHVLKWDNTASKMDWMALAPDQDEKVKTQSGNAGILSDTYFLETSGVIDIKDASVSNAKLATDAVETANIKDGEVKTADVADLNITTAKLADDAVDKAKVAADVAGSGLGQNADGSLETNVDGSTIEVSGDALQVKDAGIVTAKLATNAVTSAKITDANVTEAKLDIATAAGPGVDGYALQWNNSVGKMDWVALSSALDEKVKTQSGSAGILSDTYFIESAGVIDLKDGGVGTPKLTSNAVTTIKITDANVTEAKLDIVTAAGPDVDGYALQWNNSAGKMDWVFALDEKVKTQSGSAGILNDSYFIESAGVIDLKDAGIVASKLASNAVTTAKITDANVTESKLDITTAAGVGVDGYVLSWDNSAGRMDWIAPGSGSGNDEFVKIDAAATGGYLGAARNTGVLRSTTSLSYTDGGNYVELGIADGGVSTPKIASNAVTSAKLADNSVGTEQIKNGGVKNANLATGSVTAPKLADNSVGTEHIQDGDIATVDLAADAVTDAKLADNSVGTEHIQDGTVGTSDLAAGAITSAKIMDGVISESKLDITTAASAGVDGYVLAWDNSANKLDWVPPIAGAGGTGTKVVVKGAMGANQTANNTTPIVKFVTSGTIAGGGIDVNSEWNNSSHRFTVGASGAGTYLAQAGIFLNNGGSWSNLSLYKNGSRYAPIAGEGTANSWDYLDGTIAIDLVVGDYIEFRLYSSGNGTIDHNNHGVRQSFTITKIASGVTVNTGSGSGADELVKIDASATGGYIGNAGSDGVLRTEASLSYTDGGDHVTLGVADGGISTAKIAADAVTDAKLADNAVGTEHIQDGDIATADLANNSVTGAKIALGSDAAGDIMYNNGTDWVRLPKGSADQVLTMNDAGTTPNWEAPSGGGGGGGGGVTKIQANYNAKGRCNSNDMKLKTVTVTGAAVGDAVIVNPNFSLGFNSGNKMGIVSAWVQQANQVRFYMRCYSYNNGNNNRWFTVTVIK
jgi:hypothetical protein